MKRTVLTLAELRDARKFHVGEIVEMEPVYVGSPPKALGYRRVPARELYVHRVRRWLTKPFRRQICVVDIDTVSGCIAVSEIKPRWWKFL